MPSGSPNDCAAGMAAWRDAEDLLALGLRLSSASSVDAELADALSYRLLPRHDVRSRSMWGAAFAPATVLRGEVWPAPLPLVNDLTRLAWARSLRAGLPAPVDARLTDLLLETGRAPQPETELCSRAASGYLESWECSWTLEHRLSALARAVELAARSSDPEVQRQTLKRVTMAWDELVEGPVVKWAVQWAWADILDNLRAEPELGPLIASGILRNRPSGQRIIEDAWLQLAGAHRLNDPVPARERLALWLSAVDAARRGAELEQLHQLIRRDPNHLPAALAAGARRQHP